jgi:hypothetical protein
MKNLVGTGQVSGQVEAQGAQVAGQVSPQVTPHVGPPVTPPVSRQPESRPEWGSKGERTFLSADKKQMAGWKIRPPLREMDKTLKKILEKIGV